MDTFYHADQFPLFTFKFCPVCETEKTLDQYSQRKDGRYEGRCKDCVRAADRERARPYELPNPRYNPRNKPKLIPTQEGYRFCNACEQEKPFEEFHHRGGKPIATCMVCERARDRERGLLRRTRKTPIRPKATKPGHKICNTCWEEKKYSKFAKDPAQKDGYRGRCRKCYAEQAAARSPLEKEAKKAYNDAYREANRDELCAYDRQRYQTPARKLTHLSQLKKRQALINGAYAEEVDYQRILERDGMFCYICQKAILPEHELAFDHVVPLLPRPGEPQGFHTEDNVKPTHRICNARKSNKPLDSLTPRDRRGIG